MKPYTLAISSCNRHDLLQITIESFLDTVDQKPTTIVICEDGPTPQPEFLKKYKHLNVTWLSNGERHGQIYTCDRLMNEVQTEYVMWLEDDWRFSGTTRFIQKSFEILEAHPEVITVSLRGNTGWHPLADYNNESFKIAMQNWRGGWGGWTFNCGLRRMSDYRRIGSYGRVAGYQPGLASEIALSKHYGSLGYVIADLSVVIAEHIGDGRSRAVEPLVRKTPKVLIAVPACHRFDYGRWESSQSPSFDRSKAWNGEAYGTDIHISGDNPRISAVRDTWFKDTAGHPNVTALFFYGRQPEGQSRQPLDDEIFLQVPDDYEHLPHKTIAIVRWALEHGYDYVLKCDDDTFIYVDRLMLELDNNQFDYAGYLHGNVCTGGNGYWLSRRAMEAVQDNPNCWAEDVWVAKCMMTAGIKPVMLTNHRPGYENHWYHPRGFNPAFLDHKMVAAHAVQPSIMREWYEYNRGHRD